MDEEITQDPIMQDDMTPDEAAASLAFATNLSQGMMGTNENPQEEDGEEVAKEETDIDAKIDQKLEEKLAPMMEKIEQLLNGQEEA